MLTCYFVAGLLMISDGRASVPLDQVDSIFEDGETFVAVTEWGISLETGVPDSYAEGPALLQCASEAEARVMEELEGNG